MFVDKCRDGVYSSRFTCRDLKVKYSKQELEEETNISAPTPFPESWQLLDIKFVCPNSSGDACLGLGGPKTCKIDVKNR